MSHEIVLRSPTDAEFSRFVAPLSIAFGEEVSDAAIENDRRTIELDRFIGALDGDSVVGCAGAYTFRLTVPGGEVGAAGITAVGVLPSHRRRGILRQMMTWLFAQARERQEPVAILWASEAAIYQRFGYGPGTLQTQFDAVKDKIRFARPVESAGRVRILGLDEAVERFPPIYEAIRRSTPGAVTRSEARWRWELLADAEWMRHGNGAKVLALLEDDGHARGYVIYRTRSEWDSLGPKGVVTVMEVSALDAAAEQALWEWIFGIDLIGSVRGWRGPAPHPLQLMVTEPRRLGTTLTDGTWLRIIDLPAALASRAYRGPGNLVIELTDEFCPWNAGRWQLSVPGKDGGGSAVVARAPSTAEPDLVLDISDLAAVYLGAFRFADLVRAGRVRESRPGALAAADALFSTVRAPSNATMF
ncbi:MAG: GNAT family N-acetyltransferase [Candidatus Limnocylindrales bacterium]|nr:GNAT family N-acetyltransferase [Candidatus Limnocylindrales bacterium]